MIYFGRFKIFFIYFIKKYAEFIYYLNKLLHSPKREKKIHALQFLLQCAKILCCGTTYEQKISPKSYKIVILRMWSLNGTKQLTSVFVTSSVKISFILKRFFIRRNFSNWSLRLWRNSFETILLYDGWFGILQ